MFAQGVYEEEINLPLGKFFSESLGTGANSHKMGDSKMFLTPPNSTMGGLLPHFLCSKLRVLTICYCLEASYISILGLRTLNAKNNLTERSEVPVWGLFSRQSAPKLRKSAISEKQGSNYRNLAKIGMEV